MYICCNRSISLAFYGIQNAFSTTTYSKSTYCHYYLIGGNVNSGFEKKKGLEFYSSCLTAHAGICKVWNSYSCNKSVTTGAVTQLCTQPVHAGLSQNSRMV